MHLPLRFLPLLVSLTTARFLHSLPEDTHSLPKFRVAFLNSLPVSKDTAHRWLSYGLPGGLLEFLDQSWNNGSPREIEGATDISTSDPAPTSDSNYTLEYMRMGPKDSYICLIPTLPDYRAPIQEDDLPELNIPPSRSWALLQPLTGTCLYHRQGWFTYSYCHNDQIRQFKEASQNPNPIGGYRPPEEDPEWEAYTLGKAPQPGADLTVAEQAPQAANLELAHNAGSRYLVQKWGDGSLCDKTGKNREVEVQFHCSMTMTDSILFVKETKTCSYVLVIYTPRLCGEPGFKSLRDKGEEGQIRCREIVDDPQTSVASSGLLSNPSDTDHPVKLSRKRPVLPEAANGPQERKGGKDAYNDLLRKTIESIFSAKNLKSSNVVIEELANEDNNIVFEFVDTGDDSENPADQLVDMLRGAGIDAKTKDYVIEVEQDDQERSKSRRDDDTTRDEL